MTVPCGEMEPFVPAVAVIVKVLRVNAAVTVASPFMVSDTVGDVPLTAPDQSAKIELTSGVAVSVTTVP